VGSGQWAAHRNFFIMKITTRISFGYGFFIMVLVGLVVYQVVTINRMQLINRALSGINFQNALACLQSMSDLDLVEEYTRKSFALSDPDYLKRLQEYQKDFEKDLMELKGNANSGEEQTEVGRLSQQWDSFSSNLASLQQSFSHPGTALPQILQDDLERLTTQTRSVYQANLRSMTLKVESSRKTGETAALVLSFSTLVVLVISILVSFLIFRSISKPLASLTEGTRAIAQGKFFYRLDTSRNDEFSQLAKDFNTMTHRLDELDQLKKDFVSHVSHELKSPLASMREIVHLLLDQLPGPLNDKQKRLLELNQLSGLRLTTMIGNLLDLSRTEAGVMEYELKSQDLVPLVRSAIEELDVQAQEHQISIQSSYTEESLWVECDGDRILQVMVNLLSNAVKFSPKSATVFVTVAPVRRLPETIPESWHELFPKSEHQESYGLVTVSDSGSGIADTDKEKIFEKFHQVKQGKKLPGQGVGLGLAICRTIAFAHRGAVWVEDNPGGGSRFNLLLRRSVGSRQ
jgi:signal transduction histidine kinase